MIDTTNTIDRMEALAAWHRLNAEHAGSAWVWDARLRTAEDLERRAADLRIRQGRGRSAARRVRVRAGVAHNARRSPS